MKARLTTALRNINNDIEEINKNSEYHVGLRNGLKLARYYITGEEPEFDKLFPLHGQDKM